MNKMARILDLETRFSVPFKMSECGLEYFSEVWQREPNVVVVTRDLSSFQLNAVIQSFTQFLKSKQVRIHDHMLLAVWSLPAQLSLLALFSLIFGSSGEKTHYGRTDPRTDGHTLLQSCVLATIKVSSDHDAASDHKVGAVTRRRTTYFADTNWFFSNFTFVLLHFSVLFQSAFSSGSAAPRQRSLSFTSFYLRRFHFAAFFTVFPREAVCLLSAF